MVPERGKIAKVVSVLMSGGFPSFVKKKNHLIHGALENEIFLFFLFLSFLFGVTYFEVKFMLMEDKMLSHTPKIIGFG